RSTWRLHRHPGHRSLSLGLRARRALRPRRRLRHPHFRNSSDLGGLWHPPAFARQNHQNHPNHMTSNVPRPLIRIAVHAFLCALTAAVLYPVALVVKKSIEPGNHFALSPSPIPQTVSGEHFQALLSGDNGLDFLRHGLSSAVVALATTLVGLAMAT